jgi:hypothetical protein
MEKVNNSQLELFSKTPRYAKDKTQISSSFLSYIWKYEKTILISIFFIVTGIISFSLGVEKGKKMATVKVNSNFDLTDKTQQKSFSSGIDSVGAIDAKPKIQPEIIEKSLVQDYAYTIQVATYRTKTYAKKEAEALRKRGLSSLVLSKGNFAVVCVGNFPNQKQAEPLLSKLKKEYQGCYIRRL